MVNKIKPAPAGFFSVDYNHDFAAIVFALNPASGTNRLFLEVYLSRS